MPSIRLTVETITPLLMYGADQEQPELRGSAFRGMLRYWLRAVLSTEHTYPQALYKAESAILGSTEQGSKVTVRIQKHPRTQPEPEQWVLPERTSRGWRARYNGFPPDSEFRIVLATHPLDSSFILADDSPLVKALFLMAHIGGLGRRSRRGSGNLRVLDAAGYEGELPLAVTASDRDELRDYLRNVADFIAPAEATVGRRPSFATFAPDTTVMLLGNRAYRTVEDVLSNDGDLWSVSGPYHDAGGIFGDVRPRRASAIHMRVAVTHEGYVPQQTIFYAGNGAWGQMQDYIQRCENSGFERIYGDPKGWS